MLKIDTIESTSEIVFRLHGRLAGPWVDELESHWRRMQATAGEKPGGGDLSRGTRNAGAARHLLSLMRGGELRLVGGRPSIPAPLADGAPPTAKHSQRPPLPFTPLS